MRPPDPEITLRFADEVGQIHALEPLWNALQEHHSELTPNLGGHAPKRELADSWRRRQAKYERWLEDPETFFVIARAGIARSATPSSRSAPATPPGRPATAKTNVDSHRFYERHGFTQGFVIYYRKGGPGSDASSPWR